MNYHFIGIGGAGMSVVAELLAGKGEHVSGCDRSESTSVARLRAGGIEVAVGHSADHVREGVTVVRSTAIREDHPEIARAREIGAPILHRSEALALASSGRDFVAVAGAHGKTTTSAMLAVALREAGADPSFAIGGTVMGLGVGAHLGEGPAFVAEADESDRSFLNYQPRIAMVTNIEPDHLDFYGSEEAFEDAFLQFARRIVPGGLLVACADDPGAVRLLRAAAAEGIRTCSYGRGEADVRLEGTRVTINGATYELDLAVGGDHNLLNAAGALAVGVELGVPTDEFVRALGAFGGTARRFELRGEAGGVTVVDDYAHHPTEVAATLQTARAAAGAGRVLVLFQPHLYSRTREFAGRFADALRAADYVVVTGIYGAREDPIPGVTSGLITAELDGSSYIEERIAAAEAIADEARPEDLVITMGAGDVTELASVILERL